MMLLTKEWLEDSIWIWNFRCSLKPKQQLAFDWWMDYRLTSKRKPRKISTKGSYNYGMPDTMINPSLIPHGFLQMWSELDNCWKIVKEGKQPGRVSNNRGKIHTGLTHNNSHMEDVNKVDGPTITPEQEVEAMKKERADLDVPDAEEAAKMSEEASKEENEVSPAKDDEVTK